MTQSRQTPAEKLGFKVGDKFEVTVHDTFDKGSIVTFYEDDTTGSPLFIGEGTTYLCGPDRTPGAYINLASVRKLTYRELYKIGDKFRVVTADQGFAEGTIVTLNEFNSRDDSTSALFAGENTCYKNAHDATHDRIQGAWIGFHRLEKYVEPAAVEPLPIIQPTRERFVPGVSYKVLSKGYHSHWTLDVGEVYVAGENGILSQRGGELEYPYETMVFEVMGVPEVPEAAVVFQEDYVQFVEGVSYKVVDQGDHNHWRFDVGQTIVAVEGGLPNGKGSTLPYPYSSMKFEIVPPVELVKPNLSGLKDLQAYCHGVSVKAGWWHDVTTGEAFDPVAKGPEKIALMHSELSEALEGLRKGLMDDKLPHRPNAEVELADAVIRILDWAGAMGYDIAGAIEDKMEYNATREDHKLTNRQATGGKKF